ncbi:IS3 family transposase [Bacillus tropicus]|uniref:IS3 family transposase n=1 Tax=Bacillus tropicus TaxID=2026188 RepID=UPI0011A20B75
MESFFGYLKSENFYSQKRNKVSNITVRKILLEYIHYYHCVRIQEKPFLFSLFYDLINYHGILPTTTVFVLIIVFF